MGSVKLKIRKGRNFAGAAKGYGSVLDLSGARLREDLVQFVFPRISDTAVDEDWWHVGSFMKIATDRCLAGLDEASVELIEAATLDALAHALHDGLRGIRRVASAESTEEQLKLL